MCGLDSCFQVPLPDKQLKIRVNNELQVNEVLIALSGVVLGVSLAGPPGPVTAIMVKKSTESIMRGVNVGFGAMTADFVLMLLTFFFRSKFDLSVYDPYIFILGAFFFILLAVLILRAGEETAIRKYDSGYLAGLTVGIVNPLQIGWWLTAGQGFYSKFGLLPFYFLFVGIVFWIFFLAILVNRFSNRYGKTVNAGVKIFSVVSLVAFGIYFAYLGMMSLI